MLANVACIRINCALPALVIRRNEISHRIQPAPQLGDLVFQLRLTRLGIAAQARQLQTPFGQLGILGREDTVQIRPDIHIDIHVDIGIGGARGAGGLRAGPRQRLFDDGQRPHLLAQTFLDLFHRGCQLGRRDAVPVRAIARACRRSRDGRRAFFGTDRALFRRQGALLRRLQAK